MHRLRLLQKKLQTDIPSFAFIAITMGLLTLISAIASLIFEKGFTSTTVTLPTILSLIIFAVINFIGFAIMLFTISKIPVVEYQIIAILTPIISGGLAYLILSEGLSARYFIGLIFIAIGLVIALKK